MIYCLNILATFIGTVQDSSETTHISRNLCTLKDLEVRGRYQ